MKRLALITLILGTAFAIAPAAYGIVLSDGSVASSGSNGTNLSDAEYQALLIRGADLNEQYGNWMTDLTPSQYRTAFESGIARANASTSTATAQPSSSGGSSFDWSYVGIAAFGAMLLALGSVAVTRQKRPLSF